MIEFYNTAYSSVEKSEIKNTSLKTPSAVNSKYNSIDTTDKVFLLSDDDALNSSYGFDSDYSAKDSARRIKPTDYAHCQGCNVDSDMNSSWQWLRSPYISYETTDVNYDGSTYIDYSYSYSARGGIVPALKLK